MTSRMRVHRSALADWSSRMSILAIPLLIIAAIGHRVGMMNATATYGVMALGFSLSAFAVIASMSAFEAIWRDGRKGLGAAIRGFILGLLILAAPAAAAWNITQYPRLTDISTDPEDPPYFAAAFFDRPADANPIRSPSPEEGIQQREAYPDIVPRYYPLDTVAVFEAAEAIVTRRDWRILQRSPPADSGQSGRIEAVAQTLLFGFSQDVVIRVAPEGEGTLVDMRSTSRNGAHDFGANADRLRKFFLDLDAALQGMGATQG
jgi:uncharacterized protein (DUF1499 family)